MGGLLGEAVAGGSAGFASKRFAMARSSPVVLGLAGSAENAGAPTGADEAKIVGALAAKGEAVALNTGAGSTGGIISPNGEANTGALTAIGEAVAGFEDAAANGEAAGEALAKGEAGVAAAKGEADGAGEAAANGKAGTGWGADAANREPAGDGEAAPKGEAGAG